MNLDALFRLRGLLTFLSKQQGDLVIEKEIIGCTALIDSEIKQTAEMMKKQPQPYDKDRDNAIRP